MKKSIIVTGASKGLGEAISKKLVARGHRVIGVARTESKLAELADSLGTDSFIPIHGDICTAATIKSVREVLGDGNLSGLILNAGSTWPIARIADLDMADYKKSHNSTHAAY